MFHFCHYTISRDESQFVDAEKFLPERWLRGREAHPGCYQHHPYSSIPFGVGLRACVGRRVAELEMHFALTRVRRLVALGVCQRRRFSVPDSVSSALTTAAPLWVVFGFLAFSSALNLTKLTQVQHCVG